MKLKAPANMTGISIGGEQYNVDAGGFINLPENFDISILRSHGFDNTATVPPTAAEAAAQAAQAADDAEAAFKAAKVAAIEAAKNAKAVETAQAAEAAADAKK